MIKLVMRKPGEGMCYAVSVSGDVAEASKVIESLTAEQQVLLGALMARIAQKMIIRMLSEPDRESQPKGRIVRRKK